MLTRFRLGENETTVRQEFFGGLTSFLATFYIIIVNPAILSGAGLSYSAVATATVMIAATSTILMGIYANNPIVLAPGMGLNAFFAYGIVVGKEVSPEIALGIVFWSGILFILLSILRVREKIIEFIPTQLRYAISCGIGLFISFLGFVKGGFIVRSEATLVQMAPLSPQSVTFFACLLLTGWLVWKKVQGSLVLGILGTLLFTLPMGRLWGAETLIQWQGVWQLPDFSLFGKLDLLGSLQLSLVPTIIAFMFTDLFDTISTLVGVSEAGNLLGKDGRPRNMKKSLVVDAIATTFSGIFGTSPTTSFIESAAGIQQGARTGLSSVFAGLMFLPFLFLAPLLSMFPAFTTAPVLVIVGLFMMGPITKIQWIRLDIALPCFLAMVLIPLTFSITQGLMAGLLCHYVFWGLKKLQKFDHSDVARDV